LGDLRLRHTDLRLHKAGGVLAERLCGGLLRFDDSVPSFSHNGHAREHSSERGRGFADEAASSEDLTGLNAHFGEVLRPRRRNRLCENTCAVAE